MASPVSIMVANLIMKDVEKRARSTFYSRPKGWKRHVEDIFVIVNKNLVEVLDQLDTVKNSIKFT